MEKKTKSKGVINVVVLFDASSVCHTAKHSMKGLSYREQETGVIFGFMVQVLRLATKFNTNELVFAWDSRKSFRKDVYPDYKKARREKEKTPEEHQLDQVAYKQFNLIRRQVVPKLGFKRSYIQTGLEADDVIASIIHSNPDTSFVIISSDKDLYQLLSPTCSMYNIITKKQYTHDDFKEEWGIEPTEWAQVIAIAGCDTDQVEGLRGVGRISAAKYLRGVLGVRTKSYKAIKSPMGQAIAQRNISLVGLPYKGTDEIILNGVDSLETSNFLDVFHKYGFQSFLRHEEFQRWRRIMKM